MPRKKHNKVYEFFLKTAGRIEKRQRFIISAFLLTFLFTGATFFSFERVYFTVPIIVAIVYFLTFLSILEGITRHEWLSLFIHPVYFSVVFYLFYFFVPQRWLTRIPFVTLYIISIYAITLSQNIFNVGVSKSLQLFRAAFSVNYLFLTISSFLAYSLIVSLRLNALFNFILVFLASFPLVLQMLWSVEPRDYIQKSVVMYTLLISLLLGETAIVLSFMPVDQSIFSLILTSIFYSLVGMFQLFIQGSLFKERIREYIFVFIFALSVLILTVHWV